MHTLKQLSLHGIGLFLLCARMQTSTYALSSNVNFYCLIHKYLLYLIILVKFWETMHKDANDEKKNLDFWKINLELCWILNYLYSFKYDSVCMRITSFKKYYPTTQQLNYLQQKEAHRQHRSSTRHFLVISKILYTYDLTNTLVKSKDHSLLRMKWTLVVKT